MEDSKAFRFQDRPAKRPNIYRVCARGRQVGNSTETLALAKAISARAAVLHEGSAVAVETALAPWGTLTDEPRRPAESDIVDLRAPRGWIPFGPRTGLTCF